MIIGHQTKLEKEKRKKRKEEKKKKKKRERKEKEGPELPGVAQLKEWKGLEFGN